jgi:hypothetical protein
MNCAYCPGGDRRGPELRRDELAAFELVGLCARCRALLGRVDRDLDDAPDYFTEWDDISTQQEDEREHQRQLPKSVFKSL